MLVLYIFNDTVVIFLRDVSSETSILVLVPRCCMSIYEMEIIPNFISSSPYHHLTLLILALIRLALLIRIRVMMWCAIM
jgi:hypothetical protein